MKGIKKEIETKGRRKKRDREGGHVLNVQIVITLKVLQSFRQTKQLSSKLSVNSLAKPVHSTFLFISIVDIM